MNYVLTLSIFFRRLGLAASGWLTLVERGLVVFRANLLVPYYRFLAYCRSFKVYL